MRDTHGEEYGYVADENDHQADQIDAEIYDDGEKPCGSCPYLREVVVGTNFPLAVSNWVSFSSRTPDVSRISGNPTQTSLRL